MDYESVLAECEDPAVGAAVADALTRLFADPKDLRSLANDTHERTIAEILTRYCVLISMGTMSMLITPHGG